MDDEEEEDLEMDYLELSRRRRKRLSSCAKSAATFLFSHVGLAALVIGYSIMGGILFQAIEAPNESKEKLRIRSFKEGKIAEIKQLADLLCVRGISDENFTDFVRVIQLQFQQQVTLAVKNNGWDGKDETDEATTQWSFAGSLLYAVTVITTIGYGHVAPKTTAGRLVTILYALVGIPLTFLYLSNIGNFMAECFRLFYKKICCGICIYFMSIENPKEFEREMEDEEGEDVEEEKAEAEEREKRKKMELVAQRNFAFLEMEGEAMDDGHARKVVMFCPDSKEGASRCLASDAGRHSPSRKSIVRRSSNGRSAGLIKTDSIGPPLDSSGSTETKEGAAVVGGGNHSSGGAAAAAAAASSLSTNSSVGDVVVVLRRATGVVERNRTRGGPPATDGMNVAMKIKDSLRNFRLLSTGESTANRRIRSDSSGGARSSGGGGGAGGGRRKKEAVKRRLSLESGIDKRDATAAVSSPRPSSTIRPLMIDKSLETSAPELSSKEDSGAASYSASDWASSSSGGVLENGVDETYCIPPPCRRSTTPYLSGRRRRRQRDRQTVRSINGRCGDQFDSTANNNETSVPADGEKNEEYAALRRKISPRSKMSKSERNNAAAATDDDDDDNNEYCYAAFPPADPESDAKLLETTGRDRSDSDDRQQRLMYRRMMARRSLQARSDDSVDDAQVTVPISICLIIIGVYIFTGSMLFTIWEDWDYLTGSYFCFVTLSTIGFGDIVPGTDMKEWAAHQKLILCSLWLVVGLSLLAMCFNLMQEEVKDWFKWVGYRLGLIKD